MSFAPCLPACRPNAVVTFHRPGWAEPPAPSYLDILWWDEHLVALHKPSGLQVLPAGPFHERCVLTLLRQFHEAHKTELAGECFPH
jgi:23S rRNA-/tRNA-specific pseudouridylate synthase